MRFDVAFKFLNIVVKRKGTNWRRVLHARSAKGETVRTATSSNLNSKMIRSSCQFLNSTYQRRKIARRITVKIFMDTTQGSYITGFGKMIEHEMTGQNR